MKIILPITLMICMAAQVVTATNHTVVSSVNLSSLSTTVNDTITVASGGYLNIDAGDTVRGILLGGGTLYSGGGRKLKAAGFSRTSGWLKLNAGDTIEISNQNIFNTNDFYIVAGGDSLMGTVANPIVIRTDPTTYGFASVLITGSSAVCNWSNVKFVNMQAATPSWSSGGVQFTGRTIPANNNLTNIMIDTGSLCSNGNTGFKVTGGYVRIANASTGPVVITGGTSDTIKNMSIVAQGQHGFYITANTHAVLDGDTVWSTSEGTTFQSNITFGGSNYNVVKNCFLQGGTYGCIGVGGASLSDTILFNKITGGTHEQIHVDRVGCDNWYLAGNIIYGGGARGLVTIYGVNINNWKLYYNTIVSANGGTGKGAFDFDCAAGTGCGMTGTGYEMVGNIFSNSNTSGGIGDITIAGGANLTLTHFAYNAFHEIDTTLTGAHFNVPAGEWATNKITDQFKFQDSLGVDFQLAFGSPMLNCGDSIYGVMAFGTANASKTPFDIGYYQAYITGACGGVPTGACCFLDGTCGDRTSTQCAAQSGDYKGDGTSCATTTCPTGPPTGTQHFTHTKFAAMTYSVDPYTTQSVTNGRFLGQHMDMLINPTSYINGVALGYNPNLKMITYETISTARDADTTHMKSLGYNLDSILIHVNGSSTVSVQPPQAVGGYCVEGICQTTSANGRLLFCQWNSWRNMPDWNRPEAWAWAISKLLNSGGGYSNNYGVMEDEALSDYYQGNLGSSYLGALASPQVGWGMWPIEGDWCTGSWSDCRGWETFVTHNQIRQKMLDLHDTLMPKIIDSMNAHGRKLFSNAAAYGIDSAEIILDVKRFGRSILFGEGMVMSPTYNSYKANSWAFMDSLAVWGPLKGGEASVWVYTNRQDSLDMPPVDRWKRIVHHNYCWYMMAVSPYTYFTPIGNEPGGTGQPFLAANSWNVTDSNYKWLNEFAVDVGLPTSNRYITVAGTYPVYRRDFAKGAILYRPGAHSANMTDASAVTVNLGQGFHRVNYDSSKQAWSNATTIRVGDGAVLVDSSYFVISYDTVLTLAGNSATEGQPVVFTVTQNRTLNARNYFAWHTTGGTAQSNVDFTAQVDVIGSIGPGELTTTLTVPTSNDVLVEGNETFTVTINSQTYGTIVTGTATGTIIDNDAQGQPGTAKHFPGWRKK